MGFFKFYNYFDIADKLFVDPGLEEEEVMDARLSVAFTDAGNICAVQKGGSGYFTTKQLKEAQGGAAQELSDIDAQIQALEAQQ